METRIKERLTGALILVAALVILVPEIFSGRHVSEPAREAPPAAPASEGPPLRSYTTELAASNPPPIETAAATPGAPPNPPAPTVTTQAPPAVAPQSGAPVQRPADEKPAASKPAVPQATQAGKPTHEPKPASPVAAPVASGEWFVQVGSFSQAANAQRYAQQLRQQGYTVLVLPPAGAKGLSRVRVGPARTREAAAALLQRLAANGHKGAVVGP